LIDATPPLSFIGQAFINTPLRHITPLILTDIEYCPLADSFQAFSLADTEISQSAISQMPDVDESEIRH
jgi:hypothetical protein